MAKIDLTDELIAAFLDGNTNLEETAFILARARKDKMLSELLSLSQKIDESFNEDFSPKSHGVHRLVPIHPTVVPMPIPQMIPYTAMAASTTTNDCVIACEKYILKIKGMEANYDKLRAAAETKGWLKANGTPLFNIGRLLEMAGLSVARRFDCTLDMLRNELDAHCSVIVAVDGAELLGDLDAEKYKDQTTGKTANHAVVVLAIDDLDDQIEVHDPDSDYSRDYYPIDQFMDAWDDSNHYMVSIAEPGTRPYQPHPLDVSDVVLPPELDELTEAIAENAHESWAEGRQKEGWTWGPERNDKRKETPDMVPYCELPDSERQYDRNTAMRSIKLLYKLGYEIKKRK